MNKKVMLAVISITVLILLIIWITGNRTKSERTKTVAIVSIIEIDPITQLENGFKDRIMKSEFAKRNTIVFTYDNAQNDVSLQNQVVDKIIRSKPDLVYVLGTPIATSIQKRDPSLIIVQGAVTDPVEAGLANSWDASGKNYAATTDLPPVDKQMTLIMKLIPNVQTLGLVYNTGEVNSVAVVKRLRNYIKDNRINIKLEERPVANTSDVSTATESLAGKVQAIYIPPDNTVHGAMRVLCRIANNNKIPVFTTVETSISDGAFAALSLNYVKLGEQSADIALQILEGKALPGEIPIRPLENPKIIINQELAVVFNIDLRGLINKENIEIRNP